MEMRKNKLISMFTLIFLLIAFTFGCSNGSGGETAVDKGEDKSSAPPAVETDKATDSVKQITLRVSWWGGQDRADRTLKAIAIFEEENPNIKISAEFLGWDGYWEKMATEAAGKNLPDVMQTDDAYIPDYIQRDLLSDMSPYVKSGAINLNDVDNSYVAAGMFGDSLYALNLGANAVSIAYDPAMFEKAGVAELQDGYTWDEYADAARKIQEKLGKDVYGMPLSNGVDEFKQYLMERGTSLYNEEGTKLGYDDDQLMVDWFTYWNKLREDKVVPPPEMTANLSALEDQLIVHGKSPILHLHSNQIVAVTTSAGHPLKLMPYPSYPGGEKPQYLKPSQYFSITSTSEHKDEAAKFIDFITNSLKGNEALGGERGVPISSKVREHLKPTLSEAAKVSFEYIDYVGKSYPPLTNKDPVAASEINEVLFKNISEKVNYVQITPEEAAKEFRKEAEKIFSKTSK